MAEIICPQCGQANPPDARTCSECGAVLHDAIQPGDLPTKKTTSELEPILPQWLRDAQEKGAKSTEGELRDPSKEARPPAPASDLLAGLRAESQEDEAEDLPDWLSNLTGEKGKKKNPRQVSGDTRVELGGQEKSSSEKDTQGTSESPEEGELPPWLAALSNSAAETGDDLQEWFNQAIAPAQPETTATRTEPSSPQETPVEWAEEVQGLPEGELPDWLKNEMPAQAEGTPESSDLPDWLMGLKSDASLPGPMGEQASGLEEGALPHWLENLDADVPVPPSRPAQEEETPLERAPTEHPPLWVESIDADVPVPPALRPVGAEEVLPGTIPLEQAEDLSDEFVHAPESEPRIPAAPDAKLPDWLLQMGKPRADAPPEEAGLPDWLTQSAEQEPPAEEMEAPSLPAEAGDQGFAEEPSPGGELDSLFSGLPDWVGQTPSAVAPMESPAPAEETESLSPGSLPSWVQAMRPMEAGISSAGMAPEGEQALESAGPLAGLRGVLPPALYAGATSRPQAQSARLQVSEEQQGHADLLEQILLAETRPEPMIAVPRVAAQRSLRMGIGVLLFVVLLASVFTGSQIFPVPAGRPKDAVAALNTIESIPQNAPVLLVFDYEPALAGEMEAAAAPLLDHLIVLKAPRLTLLSTSPTGAALADRMFSGPLRELGIDPGTYANLGYLPGGLNGVRSFAQNPAAAMPLAADTSAPWDSAATSGIRRIADYAAIIIITDSNESGRTWIEQAAPLYGGKAFVAIASAQAGPLLQPYYQSGQLNGLSTGLFDAAILEQSNASRPGIARQYWDAYNLGLIAAVLLLAVGGSWSLLAGIRARRLEEAE